MLILLMKAMFIGLPTLVKTGPKLKWDLIWRQFMHYVILGMESS